MKNKILAAMLILCLLLSLCACKKDDLSDPQEDSVPEMLTTTSPVLPQRERVAPDYFDDVLFIGDSISEGLATYAAAKEALGNAGFLTSVSLSATNALWDVSSKSVHPRWQGEKMKVEDAVPLTGKTKVYLMLGMNDIISVGVERSAQNFETLCAKITEKAPGVQLVVQSVTPIVGEGRSSGNRTLNNETIRQYNELLEQLCAQNGWYYLNVAEAMRDSTGHMNTAYCSDPNGMGMHLSFTGCEVWVDYLYTHTLSEGDF